MVAILGWIVAMLQGLAAATAVVLWRAVDGLRRRGARRLGPLPPLIVVRPIRGLDPGLAANVRAALAQRYPGALETIFVLDDTGDPAYPVVRRLADASSARARVVIAGPIRPGRTGKLHAMIEGLRAARLDARLVGFADSDTRPAPTLLAELARAVVAQPDIGAAFAPAVTASRPRTVGDVGYGLLLDGIYDPQAALAMTQARSLPFIMGQTMVLRRRALEAAGGLGASAGQLVDDMDIGARLAHAGFCNVLIGAPIAIRSDGMSWAAFRALALRWMIYSRTGIPLWPFGMPDTAKGAGVGAVIGALTGAAAGAAIGAATGSAGTGAAVGAAAGGIGGAGVGGTVGYTKSKASYDRAYAVCMEARGYAVR